MKLNEVLNEKKEDVNVVARRLKRELSYSPMAKYAEWRDIEDGMLEVRYYGEWQSEPDNWDDEDDDWEIPTEKTLKTIRSILDGIRIEYPANKIKFSTGEKNWLYFEVL